MLLQATALLHVRNEFKARCVKDESRHSCGTDSDRKRLRHIRQQIKRVLSPFKADLLLYLIAVYPWRSHPFHCSKHYQGVQPIIAQKLPQLAFIIQEQNIRPPVNCTCFHRVPFRSLHC